MMQDAGEAWNAGQPLLEAIKLAQQRGWHPVPLIYQTKAQPPAGCTGGQGLWSVEQIQRAWLAGWSSQCWPHQPRALHNLAARMPAHVLGLDIDDYGAKQGLTAAWLDEHWITLPPTYSTGSRDSGGIYLFRAILPTGMRWHERAMPGGELIHHLHRYALIWPSVHPEGRRYWVRTPAGELTRHLPAVTDLPWLPEDLLALLIRPQQEQQELGPQAIAEAAADGPLQHRFSSFCIPQRGWHHEPCPAVARIHEHWRIALAEHSRHDAWLRTATALARLHDQGHTGALAIMQRLHDDFSEMVGSSHARSGLRESLAIQQTAWQQIARQPTDPAKMGCCPRWLDNQAQRWMLSQTASMVKR